MRSITRSLIGGLGLAVALAGGTALAAADGKIFTGGKTGSYFTSFGPLLRDVLAKQFFKYEVTTSEGSGENIVRVAAEPNAIGLVQSDVLAADLLAKPELASKITVIRNDVAHECLFAVTGKANLDRLKSWGDVQSYSRRLKFVTGPENSGSAATLRFLKTLSDSLKDIAITYLDSADAAIDAVAKGTADIAFFVQFPDTSNPRFKAIESAKLGFVPVIDRAMLRVVAAGESRAYIAEEVKVASASLINLHGASKLTTACTPVAYITGNPDLLAAGSTAQLDAKELIQKLRATDLALLRPKENWFKAVLDQASVATGAGLESILQTVDKAAKEIRK